MNLIYLLALKLFRCGLQGGVEAAIHAMRQMYEDPDCDAVLLIDAEKYAFNSLNRNVADPVQIQTPNFLQI